LEECKKKIKSADTADYPVENMVLPVSGGSGRSTVILKPTVILCLSLSLVTGLLSRISIYLGHVSGGVHLRLVPHPIASITPSLAISLTSSPPHNGIISLYITSLFSRLK